MHRLRDDELYHFYMGDALELLLLYPDGTFEVKYLGTDLQKGQNAAGHGPGRYMAGIESDRRRRFLPLRNDDDTGLYTGRI